MVSNEDIILDASSGISIEEQKEILTQINGIAEKNKKSLLDAASEIHSKEAIAATAKKKEILFPLVFNIAAILLLAGGALGLFFLNAKKDFEIRQGSGGFFTAEQAVIGELTASQQEALAHLRELSSEQERAAGIDAYISGAITIISDLVLNDEFDRAAELVSELRIFINTPSFELNRTFLARKEFYIQSVNSLEKLLDDIRRSGLSVVMALEEKNAELENTVTDLENNITTLTTRNTEQTGRIVQLQDTISEKDRSISSLETDRTNLTHTVSELRTTNAQQEASINQLNEQLTNIRQALQALSQ